MEELQKVNLMLLNACKSALSLLMNSAQPSEAEGVKNKLRAAIYTAEIQREVRNAP